MLIKYFKNISRIMMDIFYPHYDMEMRSLIFPVQNKDKFIDGQMVYFIDGNNKCNIFLGI